MAWASKSVMVAVPSRATATRTLPFISAAAAAALWLYIFILCVGVGVGVGGTNTNTNTNRITREEATPTPRAWPEQFHSILLMNYSGELQVIDLWYDWPNGRNFNIIQHQLGNVLYDLEWNNGTSFFFSSDNGNDNNYCSSAQLEVGILRPNWLVGAEYVGQRHLDGFLCNVWVKADFITYYEDVLTYRPVHWLFYSGRGAHVMTFEVGAVLEDAKWQVPAYCFDNNNKTSTATGDDAYASYYKQQQQQQQQTTQKVINNALDTSFQQHLIINRLLRGSMLF